MHLAIADIHVGLLSTPSVAARMRMASRPRTMASSPVPPGQDFRSSGPPVGLSIGVVGGARCSLFTVSRYASSRRSNAYSVDAQTATDVDSQLRSPAASRISHASPTICRRSRSPPRRGVRVLISAALRTAADHRARCRAPPLAIRHGPLRPDRAGSSAQPPVPSRQPSERPTANSVHQIAIASLRLARGSGPRRLRRRCAGKHRERVHHHRPVRRNRGRARPPPGLRRDDRGRSVPMRWTAKHGLRRCPRVFEALHGIGDGCEDLVDTPAPVSTCARQLSSSMRACHASPVSPATSAASTARRIVSRAWFNDPP